MLLLLFLRFQSSLIYSMYIITLYLYFQQIFWHKLGFFQLLYNLSLKNNQWRSLKPRLLC